MTQDFIYDPYNWLPSMFRAVKNYVLDGIDAIAQDAYGDIGLHVYEIVFDYPAALVVPDKLPFSNENGDIVTIIHFSPDNIDNQPLGFGSSQFAETHYPANGTIVPEEAEAHVVNFDVGIWATDKSGGSTARLEAYQALDNLFSGPSAQEACESLTGGVLIRSFGGGRFINDSVNDIRLFRVADMELVCQVYSSKMIVPEWASEIQIVPELIIDETVIVDVSATLEMPTTIETATVDQH